MILHSSQFGNVKAILQSGEDRTEIKYWIDERKWFTDSTNKNLSSVSSIQSLTWAMVDLLGLYWFY